MDDAKLILAYVVLLRHCAQNYIPEGNIIRILIVNIVSVIAVPTYFCISAFLLYNKGNINLKKQIVRILKLYLVWSIIYLPINALSILRNGATFGLILSFLQESIFVGTFYHLWFLPALAVGMLIFEGINRIIKHDIIKFLICFSLFLIGLFGDSLNILISSHNILNLYKYYKIIFLTTRNGIFFAPIFIFVGYKLVENKDFITRNKYISLTLSFFGMIMLIIEGYITRNNGINNMLFYTLLLVPVLVALLLKRKSSNSHALQRSLSTLIFCIHPFVMTACGILIPEKFIVLRWLMVLFATTVVSYVIYKLSKKIKLLNLLF